MEGGVPSEPVAGASLSWRAKQFDKGGAGIIGPHEGFADQESANTLGGHSPGLRRGCRPIQVG